MQLTDLLAVLKTKGIKITKGRRDLLEVVLKSDVPVSASDIMSKLENLDRSTVYRELSFLKDKDILSETVLADTKARYEIKEENCHHHLVCNQCGKIEHVSLTETALLKQVTTQYGFIADNHVIEFFGTCRICQ